MKRRRTVYLQLIISLILVISLMTGCVAPGQGADKETDVQTETGPESSASYEKCEKTHLDAQEHFDQMTNDLFLDKIDSSLVTLHYTLANPAAFGITDYDRTLGTVTLEESKQTLADAKSLKIQLDDIDSRYLRKDQLLTYTILSFYLSTMLGSEELELYDQPLSPPLEIQAQLPILLLEYVFCTKQDVEDYLSLLSPTNAYYESIIEFERQETEVGLGLCDTAIDRIIESCSAYLPDADHSFMAETFTRRLDQVEGLIDTEKEDYSARNHAVVSEHFVPAYQKLVDGLTPLKGTGINDKGLYYFPRGQKYYQYLVSAHTGTSYQDIPELKKATDNRMMNDLIAMNELLAKSPTLAKKMYSYSFSPTDPNEMLKNLRTQHIKDSLAIEDYVCNTKSVPSTLEAALNPAFYFTVPIDRPQDNSIYIDNGSTNTARNLYSTLAHEGYPGHMYQTLCFSRDDSCNLRELLSFSSYSEDWTTYVKYCSYILNNGLDPDLGGLLMHDAAFTLPLYAILDLNIHYESWGIRQVQDYLSHYFRISDPSVIITIYYNIVENPTNYLEYYMGYLKIPNMQSEVKKTLGSRYTNMGFNCFLLNIGPTPFSVIRPYFNE